MTDPERPLPPEDVSCMLLSAIPRFAGRCAHDATELWDDMVDACIDTFPHGSIADRLRDLGLTDK